MGFVRATSREQPGQQIKLGVRGPTGIFTLQTAAVLNEWSPLLNFTNATGTVAFTNGLAGPANFFRVKSFP